MKKVIIFLCVIALCACTSTKVVYDTTETVEVETVYQNTQYPKRSLYVVTGYGKGPDYKFYKIYTNRLCEKGDVLVVRPANKGEVVEIISKKFPVR